jgi:hypothetical protein
MKTIVVLALASLAAALAVAGCGGGEDALSKEALIAEADAICAEAEEQADAVGEPRTVADVDRLAGVFRAAVADLRGLEPPQADRATYDAIVDRLDRGLTIVHRAFSEAVAAGRHDGEVPAAQRGWALVEQASASARGYGFRVCGGDA